MTLADLVDLEAQLLRDRDADPAALEARDRALVRPAPADAAPGPRRAALVARWLAALRAAEPGRPSPGGAVARAVSAVRAALVLLGLALGWGAASAVLRYDGGHPVNVWDALLLLVALQILLFAALVASFLVPLAATGAAILGPLRGAVAALYPALAARAASVARRSGGPRDTAAAARRTEWLALWHHLRSRRSLYHRLEPWLVLGLTQAFGVAFNVGALLAALRLVVFSDVAFGWSSTLAVLDPARFHALVHALALPWRALWPDADPSLALVEATRYSRLESAYFLAGAGRAARPDLVGGWWPFLLAAIGTYGLLPRAATLAVASLRARRLLARLPLDDAEVSRVVRRLVEPHVATRAEAPEADAPAPAPLPDVVARPGEGGRCAVVLWRDVPSGEALARAVAAQTHRPVALVRAAGGRAYDEAGVDWRAAVDGAEPVVLVAEAFEAPDRAALRLLTDLRRALGPRRHLVVLLVDAVRGLPRPPRAADVRTWRDVLARLADPFLAVEPLRGIA
ncbi:hypothetical protein AMOR_20090 [Anaeromyxobacter oryzae]|uniref:DUF2868 domain-containing protein n=2 Tax=Anaeromyxobacter oryzae TaxID=2918170 RepID=A0ABM7WU46_9BACT|nr:hypothetical protein AMOR_20090 [Anaeromyxobacter oryzae]